MRSERFGERPCPPEVRGYISQMENLMEIPDFNHAGVPTQLAVDLWRRGTITSFSQFEDCLRDTDSRVHFLAAPLDHFGDEYITVFPVDKGDESPEHTLFVAMNGPDEAAAKREELALTTEENRRKLQKTGILTLPKRD